MRNTHPNLYKAYLAFACISIALGLNFWFLTPTFMPLEMPKWPVGLTFLGCGFIQLGLLWFSTNRMRLRLSMALTILIYSCWTGFLTFDFFRLSQTSLQLPITYAGLAVLGFLLAFEPFVNPATQTNGAKK